MDMDRPKDTLSLTLQEHSIGYSASRIYFQDQFQRVKGRLLFTENPGNLMIKM